MKRLIYAIAVATIFSLTGSAQTPTPPRSAAGGAASQAATGGKGAEGKLAYLDIGRFSQGINELKERLDSLNLELEPKRKEVEALQNEINTLKTKIQTQDKTVSNQIRNQWIQDGIEKERALKRKAEDYEALAQKRLAETWQPVQEKVSKFLDQYCQQNGIVLVFDAAALDKSGFLIWAGAATDITNDFMAQYNKANPASKAAAPRK